MFALVILFKLGKQGRSINFINVLFIIIFLYEVILGPFLIHGLFLAAQINWDEEAELEDSVAYCRTWYVVYIIHMLLSLQNFISKVCSILYHGVWIDVFKHRNDFYKVCK